MKLNVNGTLWTLRQESGKNGFTDRGYPQRKNKPTYTPHVDCGDYVIVINAEKVEVTGKKRKEKIYKRHTGYPGGLREVTFERMMEKHPTEVVRHAVKGMMPTADWEDRCIRS